MGVKKDMSHFFSSMPRPVLGAEIAIVESCLPRERKLKWIPPNVTMSDCEGYSSLKTDETHGIKEAGSLWMASIDYFTLQFLTVS
jgi:hypothetical protein